MVGETLYILAGVVWLIGAFGLEAKGMGQNTTRREGSGSERDLRTRTGHDFMTP